jgi:hypothetical protein
MNSATFAFAVACRDPPAGADPLVVPAPPAVDDPDFLALELLHPARITDVAASTAAAAASLLLIMKAVS